MKLAQPSDNINDKTYNTYSKEFIPIVSHYDKHTLITKNGELIQSFQINGINSDNISKELFNLRKIVRNAIKENIKGQDLSFWIHTIRKKVNLDDDTDYNGYFSANVHDIWKRKNFWDDKFVNSLYISVVHDSPEMKIKNYGAMVNSLYRNVVAKFEDNFQQEALQDLTTTVDGIIDSLSEYGARKLGIYQEDGNYYSDLMFLYRRILHLNEKECPLPMSDLSADLATHKCTIGVDMLEVVSDGDKKFASMMSIKEYQEVSAESLDRFLQIPVELIVTEVFYFVNRGKVAPYFKQQNYILKVSKDDNLRRLKELDKIIDISEDETNKFCHQQISLMIIGDDIDILKQKVKQASMVLSKIGICHIQEDVDLEKSFWSQLPGNFSFLSRMKPTILDNTSALASLHNFPTGNQYSPWGRALTLLRTEKGTPYFANFHNSEGNSFTAILGSKVSGRTTLMNFLLSESDKYQPTTLHFVDDLDSAVYVKARNGAWYQRNKNLINPFLVEDTNSNRKALLEFMKIISNHYFDPLTQQEIKALNMLVDKAFSLKPQERKLSKIIKFLDEIDVYNLEILSSENFTTYEILEAIEDTGDLKLNTIDVAASTESVDDGMDFIIAHEEDEIEEESAQKHEGEQEGGPALAPEAAGVGSENEQGDVNSLDISNAKQGVDDLESSEDEEKNSSAIPAAESDDNQKSGAADILAEAARRRQLEPEKFVHENQILVGKVNLKQRLEIFVDQGEYHEVFERDTPIKIQQGSYITFSLQAYDNLEYREKRYPKDKKLVDQFEYEFNRMRSIKLGIVYAASRLLSELPDESPKILAIDNLSQILSIAYHGSFINLFNEEMQNSNGVFFTTASLNAIQKLYVGGVKMRWLKSIATKFILPPEMKIRDLDKILAIDETETAKLDSLNPAARTFIINQDGRSIASELSIGGLQGLTQILSAPKYVRDLYVQLVKEIGVENLENWVKELYEKLDDGA